jgi:hypothetical protein
VLSNEKYITNVYGVNEADTPKADWVDDIVPAMVLPGLKIDLKKIFP